MDDDPRPRGNKIFPRNLTARAAYQPRGNPPGTRPESGVDNCFPGLELDARNLESRFFPGLRLAFHRDDGAIVTEVHPEKSAMVSAAGVTPDDLPLFLWAVAGHISRGTEPAQLTRFSLKQHGGLGAWRRIHALMPGAVAVLLGPAPATSAEVPEAAKKAFDNATMTQSSNLSRKDGRIEWALLVEQRVDYLDRDGVIPLAHHEPGDLTRTLCTPWQYDFHDCGCFYWASNKPDLVTDASGHQPFTFFMRRDRETTPPPLDTLDAEGKRTAAEFPLTGLLSGGWNDVVPVVLDDREQPAAPLPPPAKMNTPMTKAAVIDELEYLATVEHALSIEYLYAHYSLDAPLELPDGPDGGDVPERTRKIFAAARQIFLIAVDEMRHMRWVNEALTLLRRPPSVGRADIIGRWTFNRDFKLERLTRDQLNWFIDVEKPSQAIGQGIDGMYVHVLRSIEDQRDQFEDPDSLIALIKLIIDEGVDHYRRFQAVQDHLKGLEEEDYLRKLTRVPDQEDARLLDMADEMYHTLLNALAASFRAGDKGGGLFFDQARRTMESLHELHHRLAGNDLAPRFNLRK